MELSVAYTFEPGLIARLARFPEVKDIYGKLDQDVIGGGRSTYTLRATSEGQLRAAVKEAHAHNIAFNYLLNGAHLNGIEQTRSGQKRIRALLDLIAGADVDAVTVASPYLLRLVKRQYPRFKVRVSVFALIDRPEKARRWEEMGADTLCISAIACNRDFPMLERIRQAVDCGVQLIANASCLLGCAYEPTHMNLLTSSSRSGDPLKGFCLDYCFLHCSAERLRDPVNFIRATWIRPEDLARYESLGYSSFKIVERSCPGDLLVRRVEAYVNRSFTGNLLELTAPVAQIKKEQHASLRQRFRMLATLLRPGLVKLKALLAMKRYAEQVIIHDFSRERSPVYIENKSLDGFIDEITKRNCSASDCGRCGFCEEVAQQHVWIEPGYRQEILGMAGRLTAGLEDSSHWL